MNNIYTKYIFDLPIIPQVVSDILKIPKDHNISSKEIEDIIKIDPYLTARVLKIANSSYYARQREINSIKDAITLIGLNKIKAISLLIAGSEIIENKNEPFFTSFWKESLNTAFIARSIANETGKSTIEDDIFTSGILHNIGQAILFNFSNKKYNSVLEKSIDSLEDISVLENEEFGIDNREVAYGILNSWNFPDLHTHVAKYYLDSSSHSNFQGIIDVVSISKLLYKKNINKNLLSNEEDMLLTYQSRLNLRKSQIEQFGEDYISKISEDQYFKMCIEAIST